MVFAGQSFASVPTPAQEALQANPKVFEGTADI
jgi:hypothetical protein